MTDCRYNSMLGVYHDGELDAQTSRLLQAHLPACPDCARELEALEGISSLFGADFTSEPSPAILAAGTRINAVGGISQIELARLHQNVDPRRLHARLEQEDDSELLRTAGLLCALAASVLIVSTVWLAELPSRHTMTGAPSLVAGSDGLAKNGAAHDLPNQSMLAQGTMAQGTMAQGVLDHGVPWSIPAWERAAVTLRVDPRPDYSGDTTGMASAGNGDAELADWMISSLAGRANHANP